MRLSSIAIIVAVLLVFLGVQGWIVAQTFILPKQLLASSATVLGTQVYVASPVPGIVSDVGVTEDRYVAQGQTLFVVIAQSPLGGSSSAVPVTAQRSGIITEITVTPGAYVNASERIAKIVDNSLDAVSIEAKIPVSPADLRYLKPTLPASVRAPHWAGGKPLGAVVTAVDPEYDALAGTIDVRLRLLEFPSDAAAMIIGAPVEVSLAIENNNRVKDVVDRVMEDERVRDFLAWAAQLSVPFSNAQSQ